MPLIDRRSFLGSGAALLSWTIRPPLRPPARPTVVVFFLRGGADGLSIVIPHGDREYYRARPTLAVAARDVIDLDGYFGLHPALAPLERWWNQGRLAVTPAAGLPGAVRAHDDAERRLRTMLSGASADVRIVELGGWDTHVNQRSQLSLRLKTLAHQFTTLADGLGERLHDVTIVTLSEFGRTVRENGNGGTDHGRATAMLALGGAVRGGISGRWPGLGGAAVAVTTDYSHTFA
jgi:uncharacterized protein (DUF1501 family)